MVYRVGEPFELLKHPMTTFVSTTCQCRDGDDEPLPLVPNVRMHRLYIDALSSNPRIQIIRDRLKTGYQKMLPHAEQARSLLLRVAHVVGKNCSPMKLTRSIVLRENLW